jgi:hypothetical protein
MLPATVLYCLRSVWGANADEFNLRRFIAGSREEEEATVRKRRAAYLLFGGGNHMFPGRHFAFAEYLGFMTALILGYEIVGLDNRNVHMDNAKLGEAIAKPAAGGEGGRVVIHRRKNWEKVEWNFVV